VLGREPELVVNEEAGHLWEVLGHKPELVK
jgi:hypothetical protein